MASDRNSYLVELGKKPAYECAKCKESRKPEELADIIEVINAICAARGIYTKEPDSIRTAKNDGRGRFENGISLARKLIKADK